MRCYHRHSFFPLVVIALSIMLVGFIAFTIKLDAPRSDFVEQTIESVDADLYQRDVDGALELAETSLVSEASLSEKTQASRRSLDALLALRVPGEYKGFHLEIVLLLNKIDSVLRGSGGAQSLDELVADLSHARETLPWKE